MGPSEIVTTHIPGQLADGLTVFAGPEMVTYQSQTYAAFCVDLNHFAVDTQVTAVSPLTLPNGADVAYLLETYAPSATTNLSAAALQTGIWEVISEPINGPFDVTSGTFSISGNTDVATAANVLLNSIPAVFSLSYNPTVLHSESDQSFIIDQPLLGSSAPVPEPSTLGLLTLGGVVLGVMRWRRQMIVGRRLAPPTFSAG
jgi:hypothetical protein